MNLQTIDGAHLSHEEFKAYLLENMRLANENQAFNYAHFLYDLRQKCDMTLEEIMGFIHEILLEDLKNKGLSMH